MVETLVDLLHDAVEQHGDRPALTTHAGLRSRTWSFRRLGRAADALAHHFRHESGLPPGSPVVFWEQNSPELVAALFGAMTARLVVVPVDPSATPEFVHRVVTLTGAPLIVAAPGAENEIGVRSVTLAELPFDRDRRRWRDVPTAEDMAEVVFTSGTTGAPKGVVLLHRNITANVEAVLQLVPNRPFRLISMLPLSHMFEQTVGLYAALESGSTIHYPSSRRATVVAKAIRQNRISAMVAVPQVLELMMHDIEREVARRGQARRWNAANRIAPRLPFRARRMLFRDVHRSLGGHLQYVVCGGAHLPTELAQGWERMGVRVVEGYGATECSPVVAANTYWDRRHGSVGRPLPGVEVKLSAGDEIMVRGPNVFGRYWGAPEVTRRAVDEHGWYHTGDLGAIDDDGYLTITGRQSERIVLPSGLNVYPEDVERALRQEPEIDDCVVVPVLDAAGHVRLRAVVIPAAAADTGARADRVAVVGAMRRAAQRLAPHQRPSSLSIWPQPDFPRTNLLKVKRYAVAEADRTAEEPQRTGDGDIGPGAEALDRLRSLLATVAGIDAYRIHPASDLTLDLGFDSLGRLELAVALEGELGLELEDSDLDDIRSVEDLRGLVEQAGVHSAPEAPPPSWPQARWARFVRDGLQRTLLFGLHRLVVHPFVVDGRQVLDGVAGPVLIVANHCSHADTPSILRSLPSQLRRRTMVAAAADYFYRWRPIGALITLVLGTFPFSREGAVRSSLERCGELIDDGWSVLIYPEGTRSTTGEIAPFRRGIGLLATELDVPVVPLAIVGTHGVWPKGQRLPVRGPVTVRIGAPLDVGRGTDASVAVERLQSAVAALVSSSGSTPGRRAWPASPGRR